MGRLDPGRLDPRPSWPAFVPSVECTSNHFGPYQDPQKTKKTTKKTFKLALNEVWPKLHCDLGIGHNRRQTILMWNSLEEKEFFRADAQMVCMWGGGGEGEGVMGTLIFSSYVGLDRVSPVYHQKIIVNIRHNQKIFEILANPKISPFCSWT